MSEYEAFAETYQHRTEISHPCGRIESYSFFSVPGDPRGLRVLDLAAGEARISRCARGGGQDGRLSGRPELHRVERHEAALGVRQAGQFLDGLHHFGIGERLGYERVGAVLQSGVPVDALAFGGQHQDRQVGTALIGAQPAQNLVPIQRRQHDVKDQNIGQVRQCGLEDLSTVRFDRDIEARPLQKKSEGLNDVRLVFCQQDTLCHGSDRSIVEAD